MRSSLRLKVALAFSALMILLLAAQALGLKAFAEAEEEKLITIVIADDMRDMMQAYATNPQLLPPLDPQVGAHVSQEGGLRTRLPDSAKNLQIGTHEIVLDDREIHVAVASLGAARVYRVYDFSTYERRFKQAINGLMLGTGAFSLLTIWLAFGLSGLLVRQVAGLARQVKEFQFGATDLLNAGKYDEAEVVDLAHTFNEYHRRMADMIEREKEFAANVSHELRTPLTTIKTSCELLDLDEAINPKSKARLHQIARAADNMTELTSALLLIARDELASDIGPVYVAAAIEDALGSFEDVLAKKDVNAMIDIDKRLFVAANRSALAIVLSNLIGNAVRHIDSGHIRFTCSENTLHIEDTGGGIPPDSLPHVFERFYQAKLTPANTRGYGIGLAIVKKICDCYQWPIQVDSEVGKGTHISIQFPSER